MHVIKPTVRNKNTLINSLFDPVLNAPKEGFRIAISSINQMITQAKIFILSTTY